MFLIAGAKVRTFPLPAKHSDDFFSGRKHKRERKELGENTLGKEKKSRPGNGRETGGKRAAERAGSGGGRHTLLLWRAEGTGRGAAGGRGACGDGGPRAGRGKRGARGKKTDDDRQKNAPGGNANFPQDVHIFFSSKKNVKRPRKTKALLGTTYHAGNHKNGKLRATEEKYLTHTRNEKIQKNVKTPVNTAKKHPELPHSGIRDASC